MHEAEESECGQCKTEEAFPRPPWGGQRPVEDAQDGKEYWEEDGPSSRKECKDSLDGFPQRAGFLSKGECEENADKEVCNAAQGL